MKILSQAIKSLSSLRLTVFCLFYLFLLTFWGTIDQVENGLFAAQQKFFTSLFFHVFSFIWLPGAKLILGLLCVNLICATKRALRLTLKNAGIMLTHVGLLIFFVAAWLTYTSSIETQVTLVEKETVNTAQYYHSWELSVWEENENPNQLSVTSINLAENKIGKTYDLKELNVNVTIKHFFNNAHAKIVQDEKHPHPIRELIGIPSSKNPEENLPAVFIVVNGTNLDFYAGDPVAKAITNTQEKNIYFALRRKRMTLPFKLRLDDFRKEFHPDTQVAKSFESDVSVDEGSGMRPVTISMNEPLRVKDFTVYQASYGEDSFGRETSTFAIVKNPVRQLPYWASFITSFGLFLHFFMRSNQKQRNND